MSKGGGDFVAAARSGDSEGLAFLLAAGPTTAVDVNAALEVAAQQGHLDIVRLLLSHGPLLREGTGPMSALHLAAARRGDDNNRTAIARLLLDAGALLDAGDDAKWTPLHHAAAAGNVPLVRLLLAYGADVQLYTSTREAAITMASATTGDSERQTAQTEIVRLLLLHGARPADADTDIGSIARLVRSAQPTEPLPLLQLAAVQINRKRHCFPGDAAALRLPVELLALIRPRPPR